MARLPTARKLALADRCYQLLLLTYPAKFRRTYGYEMAQTFRTACRETWSEEGSLGLARFLGLTLYDLIMTSCKEHGKSLLLHLKRLTNHPSTTPLESLLLTTPLHLQIAQNTDTGCIRSINEDNLITVLPEDPEILQKKGALFVVADGMGGHTHGERASALAVHTVREAYYQDERLKISESLLQAMQQANKLICQENERTRLTGDARNAMGTTCIAAVLQEMQLVVANVGDSRAYVIHEGQIRQISRDHSLVADMVLAGQITAEEARHHEKRNVIYRCLGQIAEVEIDVFEETVEDGDVLILCTDGLSGLVTEEEMLRIVEIYQPEESVQQLIAQANAAGGPDNITAIVVRVEARN
ncbi:MAG TPA: Stp1/IreP family PP2C-type Ser/Thr phosphatase [Ktedonobacteraceae bacterium]|nr:Stp1/IreP family PP2C-type Ser/Thr phosphatase [Ktedonobacteraceae bacterium]